MLDVILSEVENEKSNVQLKELRKPHPVLRILSHPIFMHHHRLVFIIAVVNIYLLWGLVEKFQLSGKPPELSLLVDYALYNFTLGILARQQRFINFAFKIATSAPLSSPLFWRQLMGKVYHLFGGLHVGGVVFGSLWHLGFTALLLQHWLEQDSVPPSLAWTTAGLMSLLVLMLVFAFPPIRSRYHNAFELSHRFGGWASLALFWAQAIILNSETASTPFWTTAAFWLLALITLSVASPWLTLRKVRVSLERPSNHAVIANFDYGVTPFAGSSTGVSLSPLREWHHFANIPAPEQSGFRLTISRAGDWTGNFVDKLPSHVWVKGIPAAGVGNVDKLFKRVVWVATGSGIGPTLPHLLTGDTPAHLVWSTRNARQTYGDSFVDSVLASTPDALIWDTNEQGRPDLVNLAWQAVQRTGAEAVIVIANKKLTWQVVHGMESRGIPAYGAIWDS